jgi:hypothetical protein
MIGALVAIPVLMCALSFIIGVIIDHRKMTFYGYATIIIAWCVAVMYIMLIAWVPLLQAYAEAK